MFADAASNLVLNSAETLCPNLPDTGSCQGMGRQRVLVSKLAMFGGKQTKPVTFLSKSTSRVPLTSMSKKKARGTLVHLQLQLVFSLTFDSDSIIVHFS